MPTVAAPTILVVTVEPNTPNAEIVHVTAYTTGATTATVVRAAEGPGIARIHTKKPWIHGPTAYDFSGIITAETPVGGVTIGAVTTIFCSLTVPNDGAVHALLIGASVMDVSVALSTSVTVSVIWTSPTGGTQSVTTTATAVGSHGLLAAFSSSFALLKPGTQVKIYQYRAHVGGAAKVYAKIVVS